MVTPTPQIVNPVLPNAPTIDIPELPQFLSKDYFQLPSFPNISVPALDNIFNQFYSLAFKSYIVDRLDEFVSKFSELTAQFDYLFKYEKAKIMRKRAQELTRIHDFYSVFTPVISGRMVRTLMEQHTEEQINYQDLALKFKDNLLSELSKLVREYYSAVKEINTFFLEAYEQEFKVNAKAYEEWLEFAISQYNALLEYAKLQLENQKLNLDIYKEKLDVVLREFEKIKAEVVKLDLSEEEKLEINKFLTEESEYLTLLQQFLYLQYELYKWQTKIYAKELEKFKGEIEYVNGVSRYISEKVRLYLENLEIYEAQLQNRKIKMDVIEDELRLIEEKLAHYREKMKLDYEKERLHYLLVENQLEQEINNKLKKYQLNIANIKLNFFNNTGFKNLLLQYFNLRQNITNYLNEEIKAVRYITLVDGYYRPLFNMLMDQTREEYGQIAQELGVLYPAFTDYARTCAIARAKIRAQFIRSYR